MIKKILLASFLVLCLVAVSHSDDNDEGKWEENRSRHFCVYYRDSVPMDFVKTVEDSAEEYYSEITRNLGFIRYKSWSFDDRAKIYIYADKEDYLVSSKQAGWSVGVAEIRKKVIRTFPSAHGFFDTTLPHELGHIIFREFIGFKALLPLWLDEGVAMFQEKAKRWGANNDVRKAIDDGTFIPLQELTRLKLYHSNDDNTVKLFYAEAASAVYFIIKELGEHRFLMLCRSLKDGASFERALQQNYSRIDSIEDLNDLWIKHLRGK